MRGKIIISETEKVKLQGLKQEGCEWIVACSDWWNDEVRESNNTNNLRLSRWHNKPVNIDWLLGLYDDNYWENLPIGTKVKIWLKSNDEKLEKYYAGIKDGLPSYFVNSDTDWTTQDKTLPVDFAQIRVCE